MVLADTSVWIDHLRAGDTQLTRLLDQGLIVMHPFVVGELACGNLHNRSKILRLLQNLSAAPTASHEEVLFFLERQELMARGIGWVDAHLLASVKLGGSLSLWTRDKHLLDVASELGMAMR